MVFLTLLLIYPVQIPADLGMQWPGIFELLPLFEPNPFISIPLNHCSMVLTWGVPIYFSYM
jgi:hypothetical protein